MPDAKVNIRVKLTDWAQLALDPLPPAIGGGFVFRWVGENEILYYQSTEDDERVVQAGSQIRFSL